MIVLYQVRSMIWYRDIISLTKSTYIRKPKCWFSSRPMLPHISYEQYLLSLFPPDHRFTFRPLSLPLTRRNMRMTLLHFRCHSRFWHRYC